MGGSNPGLLHNRWMTLVAGIWIMVSSGTSYLYSDYSSAIKSSLHYDQQTLDTVGFFKEIGESVGLVSGLLYDVFPVWAVLLLGALQCSGGYFLAYLSVSHAIAAPPVWAMSTFLCVGANGQTFFITVVLVSLVKRFPMSRGLVIGIMKGLVGLSAAVLTEFVKVLSGRAVAESEGESVLLFLAWFPSFVVAMSYIFFRERKPEGEGDAEAVKYEANEPLYFSVCVGLMLSLATFLLGIITLQNTLGAFPESLTRGVAFVTILLLLLPLGIVYVSRINRQTLNDCTAEPLIIATPSSSPSPDRASYGTFPDASTITRIDSFQLSFPARGEDHTLLQALRNWDFWLLVAISMIGMGSGLAAMDNIAQVGASLGYAPSSIISFVSMISVWNFLGRLGAGALSELALHSRGLPRPVLLMVALTALALGHTILALAFPGALGVGSMLIGLSYGAQWSLVPTATSELFGLRHFGTLLNAVTMASPVGSYVLSVRVAGFFYDAEATKQGNQEIASGGKADEALACSGAVCFRLAFVVMAVICVLASGLCALLIARTRKFYTDVVYEACQVTSHQSRAAMLRGRRDDEQPASEASDGTWK